MNSTDKLSSQKKTRADVLFEMLERGALRLVLIGFLVFLGLAIAGKVRAQEIEIGAGLWCDKPEQVERYLREVGNNPEATVKEINATDGEDSCVLSYIAFVRAPAVSKVSNRQGVWNITPILVVAVQQGAGLINIEPKVFFTALKSEGKDV